MQVKANIDEADIGKISDDVQVSFSVDAYRADQFTGKIAEVRLEPQTVQNVVTYSVIIEVENPQLKLKPGMTANLTMIVDEHNDVLTVPNAALRFTPADMTQDKITELLKASPAPPLPEPSVAAVATAPPLPVTKAAPSGDTGTAAASPSGGNRNGGGSGGRGSGGGGGGRGSGGGRGDGGGGRGNGGSNAAGGGSAAVNSGGNAGGNAGGGRGGGGRGGGGQGRPQRSILWQEESPGMLKPIQVRTGLSDGTRTEVMGANLMEGSEVVVSDISQTTTAPAARPATNSPLVPQVGGGRGRGF
jgi:HlyD family secretion protein